MSRVALIPADRITVEAGRIPIAYEPPNGAAVVRQERGKVVMFLGRQKVEMTTVVAHRIGLTIARRLVPNLSPGELVALTINGERLELLGPVANRLAVGLLRKADAADDWQLRRSA